MKLEFLDDISDGGRFSHVVSERLIRIYDFDPSEARDLKGAIENSLLKAKGELNFASLDFIEPVNCNVILRLSDRDEGLRTADNSRFDCNLTVEAYGDMIALIEPFCNGAEGYQWLYEVDCPIDFLLSPGGTW